MSKSFSVDFESYTLLLPLVEGERVQERNMDTMDLQSILIDEGFNNFEHATVYHRSWGIDINDLRDQVASKLLGVPRESLVKIRYLGKQRQQVLVTLKY